MKLRPCPFCGYKKPKTRCYDRTLAAGLHYYVECVQCDAVGPMKNDAEAADEAWNGRISDTV